MTTPRRQVKYMGKNWKSECCDANVYFLYGNYLCVKCNKPCKIRRGVDLHGADLRGADLHGAYLHGADLSEANLRKADLGEADLRKADLGRADLHEADLRGADLHGADLRRADLRRADLRRADLRRADLYGADLRRADLGRADLDRADLGWADLREAKAYSESHDIFVELIRRQKKVFTEVEWSFIGQIIIQQLCWNPIKQRFGKNFLHVLEILKDAGFAEYYERYEKILENKEDDTDTDTDTDTR